MFKQLQIIFQPGLPYRTGSLAEGMTKFRDPLGEIISLKQSVVKALLTLIVSHHLHLSPCIQF